MQMIKLFLLISHVKFVIVIKILQTVTNVQARIFASNAKINL